MFGLFIIEAGSEPVAVVDTCHKPIVFDTGTEAAVAVARAATGDLYTSQGWGAFKCQVRRLSSDAWKARELGRFADGTYTPLPWADLPKLSLTADHFPHVSTEDGAKIAYTQDASKGAGDIQTRIKPGKYLAQFYGDIFDAPTIARMSAEFSTQYGESLTLQFADTADEIERIYTNGPSSCMAHEASYFDSSVHPCRIYAAGDLAVAYMVRNEEITARVLVWPAKKLYGRIYGDECRITDLLESASFSFGSLIGARMLRIEEGNGFVCPYIDGSCSAGDNGDHLILGGSGVCGSNQNGLSGSNMCCESCGNGVDEDDCRSDDNGNCYCDSCFDDLFGYCEHTEETCERGGMQEVTVPGRNGRTRTQMWGEYAVDCDAFECAGTGNYFHTDLRVELADGTEWSQGYFEDHGFVCEGSGDAYSTDDCVQLEDGTAWSKDWFADNGVTVEGKHYAKGDEPQDEDEEDTEETVAVAKPYRGSPTVHCEAQIEMPFPIPQTPLVIEGPDHDGDYLLKRAGLLVMFFATREEAQTELERRNVLGLSDHVDSQHDTSNSSMFARVA